jgi:hypothetical protein
MRYALITICLIEIALARGTSAKTEQGAAAARPIAESSGKTVEGRFWQWFAANEKQLFTFEANREVIFDELAAQLRRVHSDLTFEFGPTDKNRREFIISAGGIQAAFPVVESLFATAPNLPRWTFIKFRPRRHPVMTIQFGGKEVAPADVGCELDHEGAKIAITLYFEASVAADESVMKNIGYLLLDEALGEYDVETRVGTIEFRVGHPKHKIPNIQELAAEFDKFGSGRKR